MSADDYFRLAKIEANQKENFGLAARYCRKALELTPENYDIRQLLGKCLLELKKYDSARYELKRVCDGFPRNVDARQYLVNVEVMTGRYSSALCYVNELLEIRPYARTLWLRKIAIYNEMGNHAEAKRTIQRLLTIYPTDSVVRRVYNDYFLEEADRQRKMGNFGRSRELIEKALEDNPRDLLTVHKQVNNYLNIGLREDALGIVDKGLANFPADPILIDKKVGILSEMGRYQEALSFAEATMKKYPNARLRAIMTELKLESARFYNNTDPYVLYQKVYESNPGNEEAFNYLLNNALSKGYYDEAATYLNSALKRNPNDKTLLYKKLTLLDMQNKTFEAEKLVENLVQKYPSDVDLKERYGNILFRQAKGYFQDQNYEEARKSFEKLGAYADYSQVSNDYLYSIELAQKNYRQALILIDRLIARNPRNDDYLFKKSALLEEMGRYNEAMAITKSLSQRNPSNSFYKDVYASQSTPYIKQLIEAEKYDSAMWVIDRLLENDPANYLAYNYAVGIQSEMKQFRKGIEYIDRAMIYYPESKEMKLKKAGLLSALKEFDYSVSYLDTLQKEYPYNDKIKASLAEEYFIAGKKMERQNNIDSAIYYFNNAIAVFPGDSFSRVKLINHRLDRKEYDTAYMLIQDGLDIYPDNNTFYYKKGVLMEQVEQFDSAYYYIKQAETEYGLNCNFNNYLDYLKGKSYKNQAGVQFLRSYFDSTQIKSSIATFEYQRLNKYNTYVYRLNYAARPIGTGIQHEGEWFHKFNKKLFTQVNLAVANRNVFPKFRLHGSIFNTLVYEWETELGARYVLQRNNVSLLSGIFGIAKTWEDVWVNARVFLMTDFNKAYNTLLLQSRYSFNMGNDFIIAMASLGTPPEDRALDFQLNTFVNYVTRMVGGGYQHKIRHRSTILIQGNWYTFKDKADYYVNQYNIFINLSTRF